MSVPSQISITIIIIIIIIIIIRWYYSQMRTFASLMDFSQSPLYFHFSFQFVIFHFLITVCTQFHHLFLVVVLVDFPEDYRLHNWLTFTINTTNMTNPIQPTYS
jgi:hypothetical protein